MKADVFKLTNRLRWKQKEVPSKVPRLVLQQCWVNQSNGEDNWKDVPCEGATTAAFQEYCTLTRVEEDENVVDKSHRGEVP